MWNTGVGELDRDFPGVQLSRIADAYSHSVNLVPCPAPVTVGYLPPGLVSVDDFHAETFQDLRIGPWRPGHIDRYALAGAPGLDAWDGDSLRSLDLQSKTMFCELLDRLGTSDFAKFLLLARVAGIPKNDGSPDRCPLTVMSCNCTTHGHLDGSLDASFNFLVRDRVPLPLMESGNFSWTLMKVALTIKTSPFLTLEPKQCFDRLQLASLRELGSRLVMAGPEGSGGACSTGAIPVR